MKKIKDKMIILFVLFVSIILYPQISFAVWFNISDAFRGVKGGIATIGDIMFALATVLFFGGLVKFIGSPGNKEQGKNAMVWAIVALFVMFTVGGIINFVQNSTISDAVVLKPTIP